MLDDIMLYAWVMLCCTNIGHRGDSHVISLCAVRLRMETLSHHWFRRRSWLELCLNQICHCCWFKREKWAKVEQSWLSKRKVNMLEWLSSFVFAQCQTVNMIWFKIPRLSRYLGTMNLKFRKKLKIQWRGEVEKTPLHCFHYMTTKSYKSLRLAQSWEVTMWTIAM